ncbi:MAG: ATP-grasp domain-containing protein [Nanoarchaeota archaeon]|nr:ATP-grasp domain-containing protein [Nanoarchaeota archaeon]
MNKIFITDGDNKVTLLIARQLARKGIIVDVGASHKKSIAFYSKYVNKKIIYPNYLTETEKFKKNIIKIIKKNDYDLIIPLKEPVIKILYDIQDKIPKNTKLALPDQKIWMKTFDKLETIKQAEKCNVKTPRTIYETDINKIKKTTKNWNYPLVIKSRYSWNFTKKGPKYAYREYAYDEKDLETKFKKYSKINGIPLIQEYIKGVGKGMFYLVNKKQIIAKFAHQRIREEPPDGGASVCRKSVKINEKLDKDSVKLLKQIDWYGPAMVEFRCDEKENYLLEINGRFWGSLPLAVFSGVNFPYLYYQILTNQKIKPVLTYKEEVKARDLYGDLLFLYKVFFKRKEKYPPRLKSFLNVITTIAYEDVFDLKDLKPFIAQFTILIMHKIVKKLQ